MFHSVRRLDFSTAAAIVAWSVLVLAGPGVAYGQQGRNLVENGGFELAPTRNGWIAVEPLAARGNAHRATSNVRSGNFSLKMIPNRENSSYIILDRFSYIQTIAAAPLRGRPVYFSGWLNAVGEAQALLRVFTVGSTTTVMRELRQGASSPGPVFRQDILDVPDDESISFLVVACAVEGTEGAAYFDDVSVVAGLPGEWTTRLSQPDYGARMDAWVHIEPDRAIRRIPRAIYGMNMEWAWDGQGVWDPKRQALSEEPARLTRELGLGELRFPGGIFSDLYDWRSGVGPRESRPPEIPMPGGSRSSTNYGTDEALAFAEATGAELLITTNVLTGTAEQAADWVRYVNSGRRRVTNWEIGNELYLDFSTYDPPRENWTPERYAAAFLEYAAAMRAADPGIRLGASLEFNYSRSAFPQFPDWRDTVLRRAASEIDFVAVHNGFAPVLGKTDAKLNARTVYSSMLAAPVLIKESLDELSKAIDREAGSRAGRIGIGVTEWGPGFQIEPESPWVDHLKTLASALYAASVLKVFAEHPRVESAHGFKLIDSTTQGWIGPRDGSWVPKAIYYALQMFTRHFGTIAVKTHTTSPTYDSRSIGWVDAVKDVPYLDVVASKDDSGQTLYVILINRHFDRPIQATVKMEGYLAHGEGTAWVLNGTGPDANTGTQLRTVPGVIWGPQIPVEPAARISSGAPGEITATSHSVWFEGSSFTHVAPPHSVTSLAIPIRPANLCLDVEGCVLK